MSMRVDSGWGVVAYLYRQYDEGEAAWAMTVFGLVSIWLWLSLSDVTLSSFSRTNTVLSGATRSA